MDFDEIIERRGTHCAKWDMMDRLFAVPPGRGLPMWVADMDFRPPACVQEALAGMLAHGVYGYFGDDADYLAAIRWWMRTRHGWEVPEGGVFTTHGLVNGTALCIDAFTAPGDGVALMTPVYHAFARVIRAAGRRVVDLPLTVGADGRHGFDTGAWDTALQSGTRMFILCSPHNPGGRVWTVAELQAIAAFCDRHDLILVSDEIHHDLIMPGHRHVPMPLAAPGAAGRLVMMTAATKTFNIAGVHTGNVIIADPGLRARFKARIEGLGISPNSFGMIATTAAYSPAGAAWVEALMRYLDGNRRLFDDAVNAIPGVRSMPLEATYLAWVDFRATGMDQAEIVRRVEQEAGIAANHGPAFGSGGEGWMRFNLATPRARVIEAVERLRAAFADLQ
jgi:cystathionine beta-lyase